MSPRREWELSSERSRDAFAEWIRGRTEALLVLVVRAEDVSFALDPAIAPRDAAGMIEVAMPEIQAKLEAARELARTKAAIGKGFDR